MDSPIITSVDLGSNSYRVLLYNCDLNKEVASFETAVGLADGLSKTQKISDEAIQRVINAIDKSIEKLGFDPAKAIAVTTHAMRKANNSQIVIDTIQEKTGVLFHIIEARQEAQLTLLAMKNALKRENKSVDKFFLLDIGGGSTELIYCDKQTQMIESFSYGIVTLSQSLDKESKLHELQKKVKKFLASLPYKGAVFISTAGTPTTLAALKHGLNYKTYDKKIVNGTVLQKQDIINTQKYLQALTKKELIEKVGTGRDDYIDAGILIYLLFFNVLEIEESIVFDDGLREGVALKHCNKDG